MRLITSRVTAASSDGTGAMSVTSEFLLSDAVKGFSTSLVWSDAAHQILEAGVGAHWFKARIILEIHKPS